MKHVNGIGLALILSLAVGAGAADAQGKGKDKDKKDKNRSEEVRRDRRYDREDRDDRYSDGRRRGVPPGWCIGRGNPHNTAANCGTRGDRYDPRYERRDDRYDDRRDDRYDDDRYGDRRGSSRDGAYEDRHEYFHRTADRECRARASQRPLDVRWQLQVRNECNAEHDRWHARNGRSHDNTPVLRRRS